MRILFGIQCTGNGHLGRSEQLVRMLRKHASVDVLLSGNEYELQLQERPAYQFRGIGFHFGNRGGINLIKTVRSLRPLRFLRDLRQVRIGDYDAVVSDFEPMSLLLAKKEGIPAIGISNQYAYQYLNKPRSYDLLSKLVLRSYAPAPTQWSYFYEPLNAHCYHAHIPEALAQGIVRDQGHVVVYLPAYHHDYLGKLLSLFPFQEWKVFGKRIKQPYSSGNVHYHPISRNVFNEALLDASGIVCAAGFGTTAEALHLGKKLLVVPMKSQLEQKYNAHYLASKGVEVLPSFDVSQSRALGHWLQTGRPVHLPQPDESNRIASDIMNLLNSRSGEWNSPLLLADER
jgi:uncharacterized protein (TIGR00661 family)